jgi:formylglycine-generating enzyme required for sulfatase activity
MKDDSAGGAGCGTGGPWVVGSKQAGDSPYGAMDMVGNVSEWVEDDWHAGFAGAPVDGSSWIDSPRAADRVVKGGSYGHSLVQFLRTSTRYHLDNVAHAPAIGFRCALEIYDPDSGMPDGGGDGGDDAGHDSGYDAGYDAGPGDGGWLNPDASYWFDGGLCGGKNQQCCEYGKCVYGLQCINSKCIDPNADAGFDSGYDGGPKPDGSVPDGSVTDGGAGDGGWLFPDASYWFDGGLCGGKNQQCCEYGKCVYGLQCINSKCIDPNADAGMDSGYDGGPKPDGGVGDGGLDPDGNYSFDGGACGKYLLQCCANAQCISGLTCQGGYCKTPQTDAGTPDSGTSDGGGYDGGGCGFLYTPCCGGTMCYEGYCNGMYCAPITDGGNPDAGLCGVLYAPCCYGYMCYQGFCNGMYCAPSADAGTPDGSIPDGSVTDGGGVDGGPKPDGGTTDGGIFDGGATDGGVTDGGPAPDGGITDGGVLDGGSPDAGPACGAQDQACCLTGSACNPSLYCIEATCRALPYCIPSPSGRGSVMCHVPDTLFKMGCEIELELTCAQEELPVHTLMMSTFLIDRFEVTVADYMACVKDSACNAPTALVAPVQCNYGVTGREQHPMNCIDWKNANAFCEWAGKWLPTEAQWEMAARATKMYTYPWGYEPPANCDLAIMTDGTLGAGCGANSTWEVGSRKGGASPYGAEDMAGNVWEWVADWYDAAYYASSPTGDPTGPQDGTEKVVRGGAWDCAPVSELHTSRRGHIDPANMWANTGFRCALVPK